MFQYITNDDGELSGEKKMSISAEEIGKRNTPKSFSLTQKALQDLSIFWDGRWK